MMEMDSNPITKPSKKGTILSAVFYALAVVLLITAFVSLVSCHQNISFQPSLMTVSNIPPRSYII